MTRSFRRSRANRELDAELRFHVERRIEQLRREGVSQPEARRRALVELGGIEQIKEEVRAMRSTVWLETLWQDARFAVRQLLKNPGFAAVALLTLALGIGANTAVFTVVKFVLLTSLPYADADRLVSLAATSRDTPNPTNVSFGETQEWIARSRSFQSVALYRGWGPTLTGAGSPQVLSGMRVSHNFFSTLGVRLVAGRDFRVDEDQPERWRVLLLSHGFWKRQFGGDPSVVGRVVHLNERPYEVVGILPENFRPLLFRGDPRPPEVWAPLGYAASDPFACRSCWHLKGVARLKPDVSLAQARQEMGAIATKVAREFPQDLPQDEGVLLLPLHERLVGDVRRPLLLLLGATIAVLLIACTNMANLVLARNPSRRREVALRIALGARRVRIVRQLLTESVLLSLLGCVAGMALAVWGVDLLVRMAPQEIPRLDEMRPDLAIFGFTLAVSILTGVVIGLVPALQAARMNQREALQEGCRGSAGVQDRRLRSLLVVSEVALAFILTVATGLLLRSFMQVTQVNPGFATNNLHSANFSLVGPKYAENEPVIRFERAALERIASLPEVEAAAIVSTLPIGGSFDRRGFHVKDRVLSSAAEAPSVDAYYVSAGYFTAMGIPLKQGRAFSADDEAPTAARVAVISESAVREMFPGEDPIGRKAIQLGGRNEKEPWATIVGIVGDVRQYGLDSPPTPQAYLLRTHEPFGYPTLVVRLRRETATIARALEQEIQALDKSVPVYAAASMEELLSVSLAQRRFILALLATFGGLAFVLAVIGVHGVAAYSVAQRTSEFAIRMALGAQRRDVLRLVLAMGIRVTVVGVLAGLIGSFGLTRLLSNLLFEVSPTDLDAYVAAGSLLASVAVGACYLPARRAACVPPAEALRHQ